MVRIITDSTDACTCLMCRKTKCIHKMIITHANGDGYEMAICSECINKFAQELYDEMVEME